MNLLLLEPGEIVAGEVVLHGRRAEHLLRVLGVVPGDTVRVGVIGGKLGSGRVLAADAGAVRLAVSLERDVPADLHIEPIMLQRILKQATVLGVRRFHLIRSRRVEKSFFHSPVLDPGKIRSLLLEGLEQAMDTRLPEVTLHHQFRPFVEDLLPTLTGRCLIAHPGVSDTLTTLPVGHDPGEPLLLAVGPEGGWSEYELERFVDAGFHPFSMGERILHVDTAVVALLAQLRLLYDLRSR
jgi:RsmE family RNA methyltransferase